MQHADHFTRILNERESFRKEKFYEIKTEKNSHDVEENMEVSDKDSVKISEDENEIEIKKSEASLVDVN